MLMLIYCQYWGGAGAGDGAEMQDLKRRLQDKEAEVEKLVAQVSRRKE